LGLLVWGPWSGIKNGADAPPMGRGSAGIEFLDGDAPGVRLRLKKGR